MKEFYHGCGIYIEKYYTYTHSLLSSFYTLTWQEAHQIFTFFFWLNTPLVLEFQVFLNLVYLGFVLYHRWYMNYG
jgi:hypothetical protein